MNDKKIILSNMDQIHTTLLGEMRIKKNLQIDTDVVEYCKSKIKKSKVYKQGKNWYCVVDGIQITINSYSYTIITAHFI